MEKTKTQMEVLRIHNVVDAGAKGFIHFLHGLIEVKPQSSRSQSGSLPTEQQELTWIHMSHLNSCHY